MIYSVKKANIKQYWPIQGVSIKLCYKLFQRSYQPITEIIKQNLLIQKVTKKQ